MASALLRRVGAVSSESHQILVNGEVAHLGVVSELGEPPVVSRYVRWPEDEPQLVEVEVSRYAKDSLLAHW